MEEKRITVRLTEQVHEEFKIIATKRKTTMNELLKNFILKEILEDNKNAN